MARGVCHRRFLWEMEMEMGIDSSFPTGHHDHVGGRDSFVIVLAWPMVIDRGQLGGHSFFFLDDGESWSFVGGVRLRFLKKETLCLSFLGGWPCLGGDMLGESRRRGLCEGDFDCFFSHAPIFLFCCRIPSPSAACWGMYSLRHCSTSPKAMRLMRRIC